MLREREASNERALDEPVTRMTAGGNYHPAVKRCFDVMVASGLLVILAPVMSVIAVLIKLDSRGPVFFSQERMGSKRRTEGQGITNWEIKPFRVLKFRSMVNNADQSVHESHIRAFVNGTLEQVGDERTVKLDRDKRITRVGNVIRRTSLDELPQLINVVKGEMSLVGPRPVPVYEVEGYQPRHFERLHALPGITGIWQVEGRGQVPFEEMVRMDIWYVRNASFWLDLKIMLQTIPAVLRGKGAA
ncbi:MAG TPA: sugar transferase [Nitrolancea sp.]|nr:sugar transferase [Nitrolancea sp.]